MLLSITNPIPTEHAKGTGTVKNLMNSGVEIPEVGTKVSTRY